MLRNGAIKPGSLFFLKEEVINFDQKQFIFTTGECYGGTEENPEVTHRIVNITPTNGGIISPANTELLKKYFRNTPHRLSITPQGWQVVLPYQLIPALEIIVPATGPRLAVRPQASHLYDPEEPEGEGEENEYSQTSSEESEGENEENAYFQTSSVEKEEKEAENNFTDEDRTILEKLEKCPMQFKRGGVLYVATDGQSLMSSAALKWLQKFSLPFEIRAINNLIIEYGDTEEVKTIWTNFLKELRKKFNPPSKETTPDENFKDEKEILAHLTQVTIMQMGQKSYLPIKNFDYRIVITLLTRIFEHAEIDMPEFDFSDFKITISPKIDGEPSQFQAYAQSYCDGINFDWKGYNNSQSLDPSKEKSSQKKKWEEQQTLPVTLPFSAGNYAHRLYKNNKNCAPTVEKSTEHKGPYFGKN